MNRVFYGRNDVETMTIKAIKEKYKDYKIKGNEKNMFTTYDYEDGNGKVVIVVNSHPHKDIGKYVTQVIRVSDVDTPHG